MAKAGETVEIQRTLRSLTGGGISDADALPTGVFIYRGEAASPAVSVTITDLGVGEYKIVFTVPTNVRIGYRIALRLDVVMGGVPDEYIVWEERVTHSTTVESGVAAGAYCDRDDMNLRFGERAIDKWADLNGDDDIGHIDARVEWSIEQSYSDANDILRDGPYEVPIESPPTSLIDWSARYAAALLYESRVRDQDDEDQSKKRYGPSTDKLKKKLMKVRAGQLRFAGVPYPLATYPQVLAHDDELEESFTSDYDDSSRYWDA